MLLAADDGDGGLWTSGRFTGGEEFSGDPIYSAALWRKRS
jgi:hypothetical protein